VIIKGAKVFTDNFEFVEKDLVIAGGGRSEVIEAAGLYAIPGLVDIHFHGAAGHDFSEASPEDLRVIAEYEGKQGIAAICPATMTYPESVLNRICDTARAYAEAALSEQAAELVGIHMEGPFLSESKSGAQNAAYLQKADAGMVERLQARCGNLIRIIDVAPETEGALAFIRDRKSRDPNTVISLAHTNADYETATEAFRSGATHLTHIFNGMAGIHHRNPGPVIAACEQGAEVELIADGIHVHDAMIRFTFQTFGAERVILVSDSMEATGSPDGLYQLGGRSVTKAGRRAMLTGHPETIAGSATDLFDCMKYAVMQAGVPLEQAVRAATYNPAKAIGVEKEYGYIQPGEKASLILMDEQMNRRAVILRGKIIFRD